MKKLTSCTSAILLILFVLNSGTTLQAQERSDYRKLSIQERRPALFFDFMVLPGDSDESVKFASVYSFSNRYLPFKKINSTDSINTQENFFSPLNLNMEVFRANRKQLNKNPNDISVKGLEPVDRSFSKDTAFAKTYEESQSELTFLHGNVSVDLNPGIYSYVLQLTRGEKSEPKMSKTRTVRIQPYKEMKIGNVFLGKSVSNKGQNHSMFKLMSMGNNVMYGSDFYALAYLPNYQPDATYTANVTGLKTSKEDTLKTDEVYSQEIAKKDIKTRIKPTLMSDADRKNTLQLKSSDKGYAYALIKIPNSTFPNEFYKLEIKTSESNNLAAQTNFQSMWIDMPRSLLSLEFATDMLHYIVDKKTIDQLSSGSKSQREQKFRSFWKKKDPTPKTEYNELMAEYYRRIDYAYQNFTTSNKAGFDSDQGKVYITYGPPQNVERKFPTNGSTIEVWTYPKKKFVFKATSGFGDFTLISK